VRDYDPYLGRWLTQDPLSFGAGDTNLYIYVCSSPFSWVDIDGRIPTWVPLVVPVVIGLGVGAYKGYTGTPTDAPRGQKVANGVIEACAIGGVMALIAFNPPSAVAGAGASVGLFSGMEVITYAGLIGLGRSALLAQSNNERLSAGGALGSAFIYLAGVGVGMLSAGVAGSVILTGSNHTAYQLAMQKAIGSGVGKLVSTLFVTSFGDPFKGQGFRG
jgi:hypothetical protein